MATTKYPGVYKNEKTGYFFYNVELGVDQITGKRIQKKGSRDSHGLPFKSAKSCHDMLVSVKAEFKKTRGGAHNYNMTYEQFMNSVYLPYYKASVGKNTWNNRKTVFPIFIDRFKAKKLRDISLADCENFRIYLLNHSGYSQAYCSQLYGSFRKSLDYAVYRQFLNENISNRTRAIPKGKHTIPYWTKFEFEKVISTFNKSDYLEHLHFTMLWLYYVTGIRVSEGLALYWSDIDFSKKTLRVHYNLDMKSKKEYTRSLTLKTENSKRIISLDDDTIKILKEWKRRQQKLINSDFVMSYDGSPLHRCIIGRIINKHSSLAKIHRIQAKGLRHSHASYLINEHNADILVISKRLGHSSPEITLKHYSHLWGNNDRSIADMITGNINIKFSNKSKSKFTGNQYISNEIIKTPLQSTSIKNDTPTI